MKKLMKKLTKQEQKDEALAAYEAITDSLWEDFKTLQAPALEVYLLRLREIDKENLKKIEEGGL